MPAGETRDAGPTILVVDDESRNRKALRIVLEEEGYRIVEAGDGVEAVSSVKTRDPDLVLLDIRMPRMDGLKALAEIREMNGELPVLMISGHGTISTAVEALRLGAEDFLEKPLEREIVLTRISRALERRRLHEKMEELEADAEARHELVGESEPIKTIRELIDRAGPTHATVLVTGESGTGKELVAREIHAASARSARPFIKVNCAAIPDELIESELFGHEKGAFTGAAAKQKGKFARAHKGTIFLDEIGDMSMKTQSKVLRALQDGEIEPLGTGKQIRVDVRVIAATNKDLLAEIEAGRFREDLYYRLNVLPIKLPPLRERREDIPLLVEHLASQICAENNFRPRRFDEAAVEALSAMPWRGNVRELRNYLERAIILAPGETIGVDQLPSADAAHAGVDGDLMATETLKGFKEAAEREFLRQKLEQFGWNITKTAQMIGTPRSNLYKKIEAYELVRSGGVESG